MNENWVLSAGHCCAGLGDDGEIVAGTNDRYVGTKTRTLISRKNRNFGANLHVSVVSVWCGDFLKSHH